MLKTIAMAATMLATTAYANPKVDCILDVATAFVVVESGLSSDIAQILVEEKLGANTRSLVATIEEIERDGVSRDVLNAVIHKSVVPSMPARDAVVACLLY